MRHIPPKRPFIFSGIYSVLSQESELSIITAVRTSNSSEASCGLSQTVKFLAYSVTWLSSVQRAYSGRCNYGTLQFTKCVIVR
jgi:hypothetical protein